MKLIVWSIALILTLSSLPVRQAYTIGQQDPPEFGGVKLLVLHKNSVKQTAVRLRFDSDTLLIAAEQPDDAHKQFPYAAIKSAEYSYSQHLRWKEGLGAAAVGTVAVGVGMGVASFAALVVFAPIVVAPLFLKTVRMKGKKHWLTIKTEHDYAVLQLDKRNYRLVIPTLETRTGRKVEIVGAEER